MGCDDLLLSSSTSPSSSSSKHECMCNFLRDAQPALLLQSTTTSRSTTSPCVDNQIVVGDDIHACNNMDLHSFVGLPDLNAAHGAINSKVNDCWGWTDTGSSGKEIALVSTESGTAFVDVTNPTQPLVLGKLPEHHEPSFWGDIKTYQNYAFIVSEASEEGMQVFDMTQLLSIDPLVVSLPVVFEETAHHSGFGFAHNVFIHEDTSTAYVVGSNQCNGGLYMVDISTPTSPTFVGCFDADGYTHDVHCVVYHGEDAKYQGQEICACCNEDTVTIVDTTDKSNPVQVSRVPYFDSSYTHQGWFTDDHNHFLFGDETDEPRYGIPTRTLVMDIRDLENPAIKEFLHPTRAIDHNQYIIGDRTYQANYRVGLEVYRMENIADARMSRLAYFDTFPRDDSTNYNGAWSNYPFFNSNKVLVTDVERGLYVTTKPLDENGGEPEVVVATDACDLECKSFLDHVLFFLDDSLSQPLHINVGNHCVDLCFWKILAPVFRWLSWECGNCES